MNTKNMNEVTNEVVVEQLELIEASEITVGHAFHAFRFD